MRIKKIIIPIIIIVCIIFVILWPAKNTIAKFILIKGTRQIVGLDVAMKGVDLGLLKTYVNIDNLYVANPSGFSETLMADIPQIYIDYDLFAFLKGKIHLERLRLNLREFIVIRNPDGLLNVNSIKGISKPQPERQKPTPQIKIDVLELKVGRVLYKDYTQIPVMITEYPVGIDERYENITDVEKLVKLIVTRALINTAVSRLQDLDFIKLKDDISGIIQRGKDIFEGVKSPEDVLGTIQNITKQLENIFK